MTITAAGVATGANGNDTTSVTMSADIDVTAGQLVVICGMKFSPSADAFASGDCTKSSGTATLGTIALDKAEGGDDGSGTTYMYAAVWSAIVTASGTLRMQVAGAVANSYLLLAVEAFSGSWDSSRVDGTPAGTLQATNGTSPAVSGNVTTNGAGLIVGAVQVNSSSAMTFTPDAAFTGMYENETSTDDNGAAAYRIVSSGTTDQAEWTVTTLGNNGWVAVAVAYKEASGGGGSGWRAAFAAMANQSIN